MIFAKKGEKRYDRAIINIGHMEKVELTESEKMILEKRGFFIIHLLSKKDYYKTLFSYTGLYLLILLSFVSIVSVIIYMIKDTGDYKGNLMYILEYITSFIIKGLPIGGVILLIYVTYIYLKFRIGMITKMGIIINNNIYNKMSDVPMGILKKNNKINKRSQLFISHFHKPIFFGFSKNGIQLSIIFIFVWLIVIGSIVTLLILNSLLFIAGFILMILLNQFLVLQKFLNLGEKIQSLTPQIEIESKKIKEEFKDTLEVDYRNLHHSFDTLSHTFEKIASLVIRLEKIEHRANKGNLFDSKKYIGSLKDDILTPLSSLSTFLGEKEAELREKQQELSKMRVQVGGSDGSGHTTLIRARIEPLIEEIGRQREVVNSMMITFRGIGHS